MRTTIDLPDDVVTELKRRAATSRRTLRSVVVDALRQALVRTRKGGNPAPVRLTTYGGGGLHPGVDLDDSAALLDIMN